MISHFKTLLLSICCICIGLACIACKDVKEEADNIGQDVVFRAQDRANLIKLRRDLQTINRSIEVFHGMHGRYPETLKELADKGVLARIPREAFGGEWNYDPSSGEVTSSSHPEFGISTTWD
jgi:hypothetical protein